MECQEEMYVALLIDDTKNATVQTPRGGRNYFRSVLRNPNKKPIQPYQLKLSDCSAMPERPKLLPVYSLVRGN